MKPIPIYCLESRGSYGEEAVQNFIRYQFLDIFPGREFKVRFAGSNTDILEEAMRVEGALAVVPVENGNEGPVSEVMKWRLSQDSFPLQIIGEIRLPVNHHLLVRLGTKLEDIDVVASHPQALGQCRKHLCELGLETNEVKSTVAGCKKARDSGPDIQVAAVASQYAAAVYGLVSLGQIVDVEGNKTLFHVCGPVRRRPTGNDHTVFMFELEDEEGTLFRVHEVLHRHRISLATIDSVRTGRLGEVEFYLDARMHQDSDVGKKVIEELCTVTKRLRILGSFPSENASMELISTLPKKRVGIVGIQGSMGRTIEQFCTLRGIEVSGIDVDTKHLAEQMMNKSDIIFFAVPVTEMDRVFREFKPYVREDQCVVNLGSVMSTGRLVLDNYLSSVVYLHPMSAPRGLSFGGRYTFACYSEKAKENGWKEWLIMMFGEFDTTCVDISIEFHDGMRLVDQAEMVAFALLWFRSMREFYPDFAELRKYASPMTDLMLMIFGKIFKNAELYGGILGENPGALELLSCNGREINNIAHFVKQDKGKGVAELLARAREWIGPREVSELTDGVEQVFARNTGK